MPHNYNSKRLRDRALFAQWDKRDEGAFSRYGVSRDAVKQAQGGLQGTIVLPGAEGEAPLIFNRINIAFRFDTSQLGDTWTEVCAYGTAVKISPAP